jgi:hypothetical protein
MAKYQIIRPLVAFDPREKMAFTIPSGSFVEKNYLIDAMALTDVRWSGRSVWVLIQDLIGHSELSGG